MPKIAPFNTVSSGYLSTSQLNENFDIATTGFENTLSLDGSTPNTMNADLDLNGYALLNAIIPIDGYTLVGTTLGSMSTQNASTVAITGGTVSGVTLSSVMFSGTQTFSDLKLTGSILDTNSNAVVSIGATGSAVNAFTIGNAATGGSPYFSVYGTDTDIGIDFQAKALGTYNFRGTASGPATIKLYEDTDNGNNYTALVPASSLASNITLTLPTVTTTLLSQNDVATQANQETATSTTTYVSPGRQQYHPSAAKAWCVFTGTGVVTIRASYNVTSVTDNGAGDYTINFSTAFSSADYAAVAMGPQGTMTGISTTAAPTTTACRIFCKTDDGAGGDGASIMFIAFGDQ